MQSKSTLILSAIVFSLLAGCADNGGTKSDTQNSAAATTSASGQANANGSAKAAPTPAPAPQTMATLAAAADGTVAEFDKQSTELTPEAIATIDNTSDAAKQAHHVEVTGYCDRQDDKNAKQIALARASAVRSELIKDGVSAKTIRVKYVTTEARHSVTVVLK